MHIYVLLTGAALQSGRHGAAHGSEVMMFFFFSRSRLSGENTATALTRAFVGGHSKSGGFMIPVVLYSLKQ